MKLTMESKWVGAIVVAMMGVLVAAMITVNPLVAVILSAAFVVLTLSLGNVNFLIRSTLALFVIFVSFNFINMLIGQVFLVSMILIYLCFFDANSKHILNSKINRVVCFFVFWIIYAIAQAVILGTLRYSLTDILSLILGVLLVWFVAVNFNTLLKLDLLYKLWGIGALCTIIFGWYEVLTGNHLKAGTEFYSLGNVPTVGFFNPNDYAFFLILSVPILFYWFRLSLPYKLSAIFSLISALYFVYIIEARFVLLLFFGLIGLLILKAARKNPVLMFAVLSVVFLGVIIFNDMIIDSFGKINSLNNDDTSVSVRIELSKAAFDIFTANPFGVGAGNLGYYVDQTGITTRVINVHNWWGEILATFGFIIFAGFALFFFSAVRKMYRFIRTEKTDQKEIIKPMFWASLVFIFACVQSNSIFKFNITWFFFGVMICVLVAISNHKKEAIT